MYAIFYIRKKYCTFLLVVTINRLIDIDLWKDQTAIARYRGRRGKVFGHQKDACIHMDYTLIIRRKVTRIVRE